MFNDTFQNIASTTAIVKNTANALNVDKDTINGKIIFERAKGG